MEKPAAATKAGCLMPMAFWFFFLVLYFNFGLPPPVTAPFSEQDARRFYIATVDRSSDEVRYGRSTLAAYRAAGTNASNLDYRLPVSQVTINDGDIDQVTVLDEELGSQRIEYVHNNSALRASI